MVLATAPKTKPAAQAAPSIDWHELLHFLLALWPLWAIVGVVAAGRVVAYAWRVRRLSRAGMFEIDRMSGHEFEEKLALMFRSLGYRAEIVGTKGGDFGGDLVVSRDSTRTVVQAKCWRKNVGVKAVQEAFTAKAMYHADAAMVVTNAHFTNQAKTLARKNGVELWGRDELVAALLKGKKGRGPSVVECAPEELGLVAAAPPIATEEQSAAVAEPVTTAVASLSGAFCARCGEPVSVKVRDYCLARPDRFAGLVYCYRDQRALKPA
jgi:restriction system protein